MKLRIALAALALLAAAAPAALAAGDAEKGKVVFKRCAVCHDPKTNKVGPHLGGVVGRKAGSLADYRYSDAMKKKGDEGLVWTEENIASVSQGPQGVRPGQQDGVRRSQER